MAETMAANERRDGIQVIARTACMLRALAENAEGLTAQEVADHCGIPRPTVYRLAKALTSEDFVRQLPNGRFLIGAGLMQISIANVRDIRHDMHPFLERLAREIDGHTEEAVLYAGEALFVDQYVTRRVMNAITNVGVRGPLHCSANGKALLASLPLSEMQDILTHKLVRLTDNTITDPDVLFAQVAEVRRTGVAFDFEEYTPGVCACGTFVRSVTGDVVSIAAIVSREHWDEHHDEIVAAVVRARDAARAALSGPGADR